MAAMPAVSALAALPALSALSALALFAVVRSSLADVGHGRSFSKELALQQLYCFGKGYR